MAISCIGWSSLIFNHYEKSSFHLFINKFHLPILSTITPIVRQNQKSSIHPHDNNKLQQHLTCDGRQYGTWTDTTKAHLNLSFISPLNIDDIEPEQAVQPH